ncbi:putative periplasmic solute-binding protein [Geoglobus ahangari]|uniref:Chorismate dehydratase n=1 Tax=Geoglobus ahangari TaxID=113653 RepID=A0A0F7IIH1_9EURY|nr:menaquinone biosynthesis protein [Geoglobus ahangari]AKG91800.1 putative periplasmic solute-binding protein [Geoglobus ahangari]
MRVGKFGLVNNFLPYYHLEKEGRYEIVEDSPKNLARMLQSGEIDYAPVPSFFYLANRDRLEAHSFCVASDGEVYSVVVVSKRKRLDDSPIAVTTKSVTSARMLEIIVREKGMINRLVPADGSFFEMLESYDHALVIGDEAIKARMVFRVVMDIGEEWREITGLPAVFGISASQRGRGDARSVDDDLVSSYRKGMETLDEVVEIASMKFRMPAEFLRVYFSELVHVAGKRELRSLDVFEEMCHEHGLL